MSAVRYLCRAVPGLGAFGESLGLGGNGVADVWAFLALDGQSLHGLCDVGLDKPCFAECSVGCCAQPLSWVRFLNPTSGNCDSVDFKLGPGHLKCFFLSKLVRQVWRPPSLTAPNLDLTPGHFIDMIMCICEHE